MSTLDVEAINARYAGGGLTFRAKRTPTVMDGVVIRYQIGGGSYDGEISASRNGVLIAGHWPVISDQRALQAIMEVIVVAGSDHRLLRRGVEVE